MPLNMAVSCVVVGIGLSIHALGDLALPYLGNFISDTNMYSRRSVFNRTASKRLERVYRGVVGGTIIPYQFRTTPKWMQEPSLDPKKYKAINCEWDEAHYKTLPVGSAEHDYFSRYRPFVYSDEWKQQLKINEDKFVKFLDFTRQYQKKQKALQQQQQQQ